MATQLAPPTTSEYTEFARRHEPALRHSLVAHLGYHVGREAAQDALGFAWEHWETVRAHDRRPH